MKNIIVKEDSGLAWIRLSLVFILCALGFIGMWSVVMILPSIESEFQITRSSVTIPYVLTMFGFGIGNIIVGKNRGIITTDEGITIEADQFEFNKFKNILQAKGNIIIKDQINK